MADEPENLVLMHLREIRSRMDSFGTKVDGLIARFDKASADFKQWQGYVTHILGLASMNNIRADALEAGMTEQEFRLKRIEELSDLINRRVTRLEDVRT